MNTPMDTRRRVNAVLPASPTMAARHFAARLQYETDPSDVWADIRTGAADFTVVDARHPAEYARGHVPGAVNLPHADIDESVLQWLPIHLAVVTYCSGVGCNASTRAALALAALGYRVKEMIGGLEWWVREGYAVETATELRDRTVA
jgi:rhodanese-related sulfurtransferase